MTDGAPIVVLNEEQLRNLLRSEITAALIRWKADGGATAPAEDRLMTFSEIIDTFKVGRRRLREMVESGRLKATVRKFPGGKEGYLLRASEASRIFEPRQLVTA